MELLEQLTQTAAISGREHRIRQLIQSEIKGLFDEVRTDPMGSLICLRHPRPRKSDSRPRKQDKGKTKNSAGANRPLRVMVAAHMDQIGFLVRHIDDKGFIRVNAVGGFDTRNLFARLCTVCPDLRDPSGDLLGVMNPGGKPVHIASDEDRKKIPDVSDLLIDLGLPPGEVKKQVKVGHMVVLAGPMQRVGHTVVSQCLDNRIACWVAIRAIQQLEKKKIAHACEIAVVFTVQEEVGLRGAQTSAYALAPDVGIAVDTTLCVDTPGVPDDQRVTLQGEGASLDMMDASAIADLDLVEEFEDVARKNKIKCQRTVMPRGGTDQGTIQRAGQGAKTLTLACPTRYIHTITEMIHLDDLHACRDLLAAYLAQASA
ncbi:MAG: M20/M25/M40 family metallo-hydrolase [Phycisphaeraceae bacterium]|nr:M20/M25/M40 family metallo-hydrolase [Phycisphaeraceae bacterium]